MSTDQPSATGSVMIVDDQAGIRLTLSGILTKKGYRVCCASDGAEALALAKSTVFRIIFLDIKMPGLSGVDTFIKIKEINPQAIVIMMTGFANEDDIIRAIKEGAYTVIYKPFDMVKIFAILDETKPLQDMNLRLNNVQDADCK